MRRVRQRLSREMPELTTYFQAGGLVDGVINQGLPAPIDVQVSSNDMDGAYDLAQQLAAKIRTFPNVSGIYIPQDLNYPGIALNIDREKASLIGLSAQRRRRQRDYRPDLRRHDRPQLLDRSKERQQLHGHRAVCQPLDQPHVDAGLRKHPAARHRIQLATAPWRKRCRPSDLSPGLWTGSHRAGLYAAQFGCQHPAHQHSDRSRSLPDSPRHRRLRLHENRGAAGRGRAHQQSAGEYENGAQHRSSHARRGGEHEPVLPANSDLASSSPSSSSTSS